MERIGVDAMIFTLLPKDQYYSVQSVVEAFCDELNIAPSVEDEIIKRLGRQETTVIVAKNGRIVGAIGFRLIGKTAVPDFFYVDKMYRGNMIGGKLHKMALEEIKKQGGNKAMIVVPDERVKMYEKLGYKTKSHILELEV